MKCPGCGGDVPNVALKCKHCGVALKKQAPPPAAAKPAPKPPKPDDPLKALAKEALAQQKAKQAPAKGAAPGKGAPAADAKGAPPRKKTPTGSLAPDAAGGHPPAEGEEGAEALAPPKPVDPRRQVMINAGVGVAVALAAAIGWRTDAAQAYVANWAAGTVVRDLPFEVVEGEYLGAGAGQVRVPEGFKEVPGPAEGTRGLGWDLQLELAFAGRRDAAFTLVGKRVKYEEALAAAQAIDPGTREFAAKYGKNAFRTIRYKAPPADGSVGKLRTVRFYQSKKEVEAPLTLEFAYEENAKNKVLMDKLIDRVLTSIVE